MQKRNKGWTPHPQNELPKHSDFLQSPSPNATARLIALYYDESKQYEPLTQNRRTTPSRGKGSKCYDARMEA
ncbi:hypothetical protein GP486_006966 [Trichoglossum hirsutum]|uniref:Uncharacterized protein n=1 Tax=Trichoglossum hirsutum TaxID=265104 RepID=A0A9P8IJS8_9PEZI|nr:hypothetical protein GP486_006966 [Trichoglossum hirsutum]